MAAVVPADETGGKWWCDLSGPADCRARACRREDFGLARIGYGLETDHAGQFGQADALRLEIVQIDSNQVSAWQLLGVIAGQTGRDDLAIDYYHAVLRLEPDVAEAHFNLGSILRRKESSPRRPPASSTPRVRCPIIPRLL